MRNHKHRGEIHGRQDGETLRRRSIANRSDSELRSQINASGGSKEASSSSVHHDVTRQKTACEQSGSSVGRILVEPTHRYKVGKVASVSNVHRVDR